MNCPQDVLELKSNVWSGLEIPITEIRTKTIDPTIDFELVSSMKGDLKHQFEPDTYFLKVLYASGTII